MHIFIDETGSFSGTGSFPSPSLVGALIIPDCKIEAIFSRYAKIRRSLPQEKGEVKGRLLNESQVAKIVGMLRQNNTLFEAVMIDLGTHTREGILRHRDMQAEKLTANLNEQHHPNLVSDVWALRHTLELMQAPLYAQSIATFALIDSSIRNGTLYFAQRVPQELSKFNWVIDAKGTTPEPTHWESWWTKTVLPFLESKSFHDPFPQFEGGDYTYLDRFNGKISEYKRQFISENREEKLPGLNLGLLLTESFRFGTEAEHGLELVDIITNATRRALIGNLGSVGWEKIPSIMIHRGRHYIDLISLEDKRDPNRKFPYREVLRKFSHGGRQMLAPRFYA